MIFLTRHDSPQISRKQLKKTYVASFVLLFFAAGIKNLSFISTMRTSPDWMSAEPSQESIIGRQSVADKQFSGVYEHEKKENMDVCLTNSLQYSFSY